MRREPETPGGAIRRLSAADAAALHIGVGGLSPVTPCVALGYGVTPGGRRTALAPDLVPRALNLHEDDHTWRAGDEQSYEYQRKLRGRVCGVLPTCNVVRSPDGGTLARMEHAAQEYVSSWLNSLLHMAVGGPALEGSPAQEAGKTTGLAR